MEKLIPISKKQHDSFNNITATIRAYEQTLQTMANTILQGIDEDLGTVTVPGVRCAEGVYSLVVEVAEQPARS